MVQPTALACRSAAMTHPSWLRSSRSSLTSSTASGRSTTRRPVSCSPSLGRFCVVGEADASESLVAADEVGGPSQSELAQRGGGETGAVALVAHDDDALVDGRDPGKMSGTSRVQPPLQNIPVNHDGTSQGSIPLSLLR